MQTILRDSRIPQVKKILNGIVAKVDIPYSDILITGDNTLVIFIRNTLLTTVDLHDIQPEFLIACKYSDIITLEDDYYIPLNDGLLVNHMIQLYDYYKAIYNNPNNLLATELDVLCLDEFSQFSSMKSADGSKLFKISNSDLSETYFIPLFSGFPTINKADKLGINVYNMNDNRHLLIQLNIFKKKINRNIHMHYKTIKL